MTNQAFEPRSVQDHRQDRLAAAFQAHFGRTPELFVSAPGRVNVLGEHVDYNDGPVLPAAIDRGVLIAAAPRRDDLAHLYAINLRRETTLHLDGSLVPTGKHTARGAALPGWAAYPAGVAWALRSAGLATPGVDALYGADIPIAAGLSSSAAVQVAFAVLWQALGGWQLERLELASLCRGAENDFVGLEGGLMDQFVSACGVAGHVLHFDTRSLQWEALPLPEEVALVIADSGVRRSLVDSAYNLRRGECEQALAELQAYLPAIRSLRDVSPTEFAAYSDYLSETPRRRAEHVVKEIARVGSAVGALKRNDLKALGALLYAGHASLRRLYAVSTPELDRMVEIARGLHGCLGARLTGAGFGGCTVNLVESASAGAFIAGMRRLYQPPGGGRARVFKCTASAGARVVAS